MTLSLKHAFQSAIADEHVAGEVGPEDWNAEHVLTQAAGILGSVAGGATTELTAAQVKTLLALVIADVSGLQAALDAKATVASVAALTAADIDFAPAAGIGATDVQAAIVEVLSDAAAAAAALYAPGSAAYLTVGAVGGLANERAVAVGQGLVATDGGAGGAYTIRRGSENTVTNGLDWPVSDDACIRLAAGIDGLSYGVVYYGGGNGLNLYDTFSGTFRPARIPGNFLTVNLTNCTINGVTNQARVAGTQYYIYAYFASAGDVNAAYELSTTVPTAGDPLGATNVTGWHMKNDGTRNKRLVGTAQSDAAGVFWRAGARGVYMSGISSYYQKQHLNYHLHVTGGNSQTVYTEINSNQYLSAMMWDDGDEPFINISGTLQSTNAGAKVWVGISIDGESPPYDETPNGVYCAVANQPYPFSVTVTGGDFSTILHTYRILMKNTAGTGSINVGSNFAMKLEQ